MFKKKFHGKLNLLFGLFFCLLLGLSSTTCYASEVDYTDFDIPLEFWQTLINYTKVNGYQDNFFTDEKITLVSNTLYNFYNSTAKSQLKTMVNTYNSNADERNLIVFIKYDSYSSSDFNIWFLISNNTLNNIPNRYSISINSNNTIRCLLSRPAMKLTYTKYNNQIQVGGYLSGTTNNQEALTNNNSWYYDSNNIDVLTSTINNTPFFGVNSAPLNTIPLNNTQYHLNGYYDINYVYVPDEPSGDVTSSGDVTPSGDIGGFIDYTNNLNNINNSINTQGQNILNQISGDTQKVIDNQNQNTDKIVGAINNANENYWGSSGDLTGDQQEDFIEDSINSLISDVSGELHENAVFQHLDTAENIFLDFFRNKKDESYYDLIISWDTLSPVITMFDGSVTVSSGQSIINGDSINISQLCRDNPELAKIQQYIRIIFNFGCLIALLWQIYNLVLSTLGIDNPYLYEDADVTDVVNGDTGEVRTYYRTRKRYYKKR